MKKRIFCVAVASLLCLTMLAGCGKVTCEICGEKKSGKERTIAGQTGDICNDCYDELKELQDSLGL